MKLDQSHLCARMAKAASLIIAISTQATLTPVEAFAQDKPSLTQEEAERLELERLLAMDNVSLELERVARQLERCLRPQPTGSDLRLTNLFPRIATFAPTQLRMVNDHLGLGGKRHEEYVLDLDNDQFKGNGHYNFEHYDWLGPQVTQGTTSAAVRREDVMNFVLVALQVAVEEKQYKPRICVTHHHPSLEIQLRAGRQTLRIWSRSQGLTPWGIEFGNRSFVADTSELGKAFEPLAAVLESERELKELRENPRKRSSPSETR